MGTSLTQIITISMMESGPEAFFLCNIFLSVLIPVEFANVLFLPLLPQPPHCLNK